MKSAGKVSALDYQYKHKHVTNRQKKQQTHSLLP